MANRLRRASEHDCAHPMTAGMQITKTIVEDAQPVVVSSAGNRWQRALADFLEGSALGALEHARPPGRSAELSQVPHRSVLDDHQYGRVHRHAELRLCRIVQARSPDLHPVYRHQLHPLEPHIRLPDRGMPDFHPGRGRDQADPRSVLRLCLPGHVAHSGRFRP